MVYMGILGGRTKSTDIPSDAAELRGVSLSCLSGDFPPNQNVLSGPHFSMDSPF